MAYNILSMRYPHTNAGSASAKWISGIDPSNVKLTPSGEKIVKEQALNVKATDNAICELKALDRQIASLCVKRELMHYDVVKSSFAAVAPVVKSYKNATSIYKEFTLYGFASDSVKRAVRWLRETLFDDSQDVYREILCTEINLIEDRGIRLNFIFEHAPSCRCFSIGIPVQRPKQDATNLYAQNSKESFCPDYAGDKLCTDISGLDLVQPYNNGNMQTIAYHYDIRVFKKQLDDYVRNGFQTPAEKDENQQMIWFRRKYFDSETCDIPMSMFEYQNESI